MCVDFSKFQFQIWIYCQALYHGPLARVIAQALPVFDVKFTFYIYIYDAANKILERCTEGCEGCAKNNENVIRMCKTVYKRTSGYINRTRVRHHDSRILSVYELIFLII